MAGNLQKAYEILFTAVLIILSAGMLLSLIRTVIGPRIADRIMGVNMIGTFTILAIAVLAAQLAEGWLLDVCLVYCMISFLAVVVLAKVFITVYIEKHSGKKGERRHDD